MAKKQPGGVGRGRGIVGSGTADKFGRSPAEQGRGQRKLGTDHNFANNDTVKWANLPKRAQNKGTLKNHGIVKGYRTGPN